VRATAKTDRMLPLPEIFPGLNPMLVLYAAQAHVINGYVSLYVFLLIQ